MSGMGENKNSDRALDGKPERKKPPGRHTHRGVDVTKMDLK
jgi:hypothetical protein